jgi:gas vesicle protein
MVGHNRSHDESADSSSNESGRSIGLGTLAFVAACGLGIGLLTAPETGTKVRKRLRKRLAAVGSEVVDRWDDVHDRFDEARKTGTETGRDLRKGVQRSMSKIREDIEDRWDATQSRFSDLEGQLEHLGGRERDEGGSGMVGVALGLAAGAGLAYFMLADNAAPARTKVREMASDLRQQATDHWQQFRRNATDTKADATTAAEEARF